MEPQLLDSLSRVGYEPGLLARLAETTEFVEIVMYSGDFHHTTLSIEELEEILD